MQHGRNHDERLFHCKPPRANNTPADDPESSLEAELLHSGRGGMTPRQGLVGAYERRGRYSDTVQSEPTEAEPPEEASPEAASPEAASPPRAMEQ